MSCCESPYSSSLLHVLNTCASDKSHKYNYSTTEMAVAYFGILVRPNNQWSESTFLEAVHHMSNFECRGLYLYSYCLFYTQ